MTKILNGGGGLSVEQIKDATVFFPRAKLLSAYGVFLIPHLFVHPSVSSSICSNLSLEQF